LGLQAGGTILGMIGQAQANEQQRKEKELEAQQLRDSLAIYQSQKEEVAAEFADIEADKLAAGKLKDIGLQSLTMQGMEVAYQGAQATGSIQARAGAGNVGGESVLRQANRVQTQVGRQMTLIKGEREKTLLGYEDTLRGLESRTQAAETSLLTAGLQAKWATEKADLAQEEADWLRDYGWMSVLGIGFKGAAGIASAIPEMPAWGT